MFSYDIDRLRLLLTQVMQELLPAEACSWLEEVQQAPNNTAKWNSAFAMVPRKTGRNITGIPSHISSGLQSTRPGFSIDHWSIDKICRICLLLGLEMDDKEKYIHRVENLFLCGEVSELGALYSSLPLLAYPANWKNRCAEGIRSNMATVLESIMYHNPYPAEQLEEKAWNQMVLKAIFTEKDLNKITGLNARANQALADALIDFANERSSAGRKIIPELWQLVGKFISEENFQGIRRVFNSQEAEGKKAILQALSASQSGSMLVQENAIFVDEINSKTPSTNNAV
jgi:hypothetical protein